MTSSLDPSRTYEAQELFPVADQPASHSISGRLSPKRPPVETAGLADVFPYYAGFSFEWACDHLAKLLPSDAAVVLDPWNGSGTTTLAAQSLGITSVGVDLNPVANVVARLRSSITPNALIAQAPTGRTRASNDDPLLFWFSSRTASRLRAWKLFLDEQAPATKHIGTVAIFRTVRSLTKCFEGSNPTWVKQAKTEEEKVDVSPSVLDALITEEQEFLLCRTEASQIKGNPAQLITASSSRMPIATSSVDAILTSPPYLTRIDYAVAYTRELAILGVNISRDRTLRENLMGTTLIRREPAGVSFRGNLAGNLLLQISSHSSKASAGYYLKQARQYLQDLGLGLNEITRVAKRNAHLTLVVQDSYYKDIPVPLAGICVDEAELRGWTLLASHKFPVKRSLTSLNRSARAYQKAEVHETVMTFKKTAS